MRKFRALLLAATVAGLTVAGGSAASATTLSESDDSATITWTAPTVTHLGLDSMSKLKSTLVWGWRP